MDALEQELLNQMNYVSEDDTCRNCRHFVPVDCSGSANALAEHCALNPPIKLFAIGLYGRCDHFKSRG